MSFQKINDQRPYNINSFTNSTYRQSSGPPNISRTSNHPIVNTGPLLTYRPLVGPNNSLDISVVNMSDGKNKYYFAQTLSFPPSFIRYP